MSPPQQAVCTSQLRKPTDKPMDKPLALSFTSLNKLEMDFL